MCIREPQHHYSINMGKSGVQFEALQDCLEGDLNVFRNFIIIKNLCYIEYMCLYSTNNTVFDSCG